MKNIKKVNDFKIIEFEEEIEVNENKLEFYFYNAYAIFLDFINKNEVYFYDGYLTLDIENKTSYISVVEINDNDDRKYYKYIPNKNETEEIFKRAEEYCQKQYNLTMKEFMKDTLSEEVENEQ